VDCSTILKEMLEKDVWSLSEVVQRIYSVNNGNKHFASVNDNGPLCTGSTKCLD
jgi:hypothetical protein